MKYKQSNLPLNCTYDAYFFLTSLLVQKVCLNHCQVASIMFLELVAITPHWLSLFVCDPILFFEVCIQSQFCIKCDTQIFCSTFIQNLSIIYSNYIMLGAWICIINMNSLISSNLFLHFLVHVQIWFK